MDLYGFPLALDIKSPYNLETAKIGGPFLF